jgi:GT2 family glycosyltransferase
MDRNPTGDGSRRPVLAVTVVSSNEKLLIPCLDSLLRYRPGDCEFHVHVAWNGPSRGLAPLSPELVKRYPGVEMIESTVSGFPFNQNLLLSRVRADYYLVINDDLIFLPGSVEKPLAYMQRPESSRIGMLTVRLLNADGSLQPSTYSFAGLFRTVLSVSGLRSLIPLSPKLFRLAHVLGLGRGKSQYWSHTETVEVDSSRGAYLLVRDEALREAGLWDVKGGEETEWQMRFHAHRWKIVFYHEAEVIHLGSMTVSSDPEAELTNLRSFMNIYYKHLAQWRYVFVRFCFLLTYVTKYVVATLRGSTIGRKVARKGVAIVRRWPKEVS